MRIAYRVASVTPSAAQHADVAVRDQQDAGAAPRRRRHRRNRLRRRRPATTGWPGRNGARCFATPIGPMPGPPPPCGIANVLCRFRWQTSAPIAAGLVRPDLRVHVRAVHVDLAAVLVDDRADVADRVLEHAVRRRIGDHQRRQALARAPPPSPSGRRRRRCRSASVATTTTLMPAITALAGLVPCADAGISTTSRCAFAARRGGTRESPSGRRTRPARRSSAAATRRRSR